MDDEAKEIAKGINVSGVHYPFVDKGIFLGKVKYFYIQSDDQQIQARKGDEGFSIAKANTCFVVGTYVYGIQPGNCRNSVEQMRDRIIAQNL